MLLGLSNVPVSFFTYIIKIVAEKFDIFVIIYLDNILINNNKIDYTISIYWVLQELRIYLL